MLANKVHNQQRVDKQPVRPMDWDGAQMIMSGAGWIRVDASRMLASTDPGSTCTCGFDRQITWLSQLGVELIWVNTTGPSDLYILELTQNQEAGMRVNPIIAKLRREHAGMRRITILIRLQLDLIERHAEPDMILLTNALYYMRKFPSVVHHPKEDLVFEKLLKRGAPVQKEVERIHAEHQEIYALEDNLIELALALQQGDQKAQKRLLEFGRHYLALQALHAETEERILFPAAIQNLRASDWKEVREKAVSIDDPLFDNNPTERYRYLYDYLLREAADSGVSFPEIRPASASSSSKTSSSR